MIWKELVNKAYKEKIYWFKKMGCHSDNRYSKKKKQTKPVCVCVCVYMPFTLEKGMILPDISKRVAFLLCYFQWARQKKNIKNEQLMIKCGQFYSLNSVKGIVVFQATFRTHFSAIIYLYCILNILSL